MSKKRRVAAACFGCIGLGAVTASASLLPVSSGTLASGDALAGRCDSDGVTVSYSSSFDASVADYRTTAVTVSSIDASCAGRNLRVTVRSGNGTALWQGNATVPVGSLTMNTAPLVSSAVAGWAVSIVAA